ncbi:MAG TPA: sugar phosphate isomerase/epimerase [Oscillospiraceae bacterium]|nr:sugar phosphate isomerase/epimerase [Oscillospiraceae bacterium]
MDEIRLGVQLYTLRDYCQTIEGFEETLKMLSSIGCDVVQISGIGDFAPEEKARLTEKYNMTVCLTHISYDRFFSDYDNLINEHRLIKCKNIGIGSMPSDSKVSATAISEFIEKTSEISEKLGKDGFNFNYHNHAFEFEKHDGKITMDRLINETPKEAYAFVPDTYWMQYGGVTPQDYLKKMNGRVEVCHFKDMKIVDSHPRFAECGQGNLDLDSCYRTCKEIGVKYIVLEQDDCYDTHPYDAVKIGFEGLKEIAARNS